MGVMYPRPKPTIAHSPSERDKCGVDVRAISCAFSDTVLNLQATDVVSARPPASRRVTDYCTSEAPIWACWGAGSVALCATIGSAHSKHSGSKAWHGARELLTRELISCAGGVVRRAPRTK